MAQCRAGEAAYDGSSADGRSERDTVGQRRAGERVRECERAAPAGGAVELMWTNAWRARGCDAAAPTGGTGELLWANTARTRGRETVVLTVNSELSTMAAATPGSSTSLTRQGATELALGLPRDVNLPTEEDHHGFEVLNSDESSDELEDRDNPSPLDVDFARCAIAEICCASSRAPPSPL
jgi:hypothetical protein